MTEIQTKLNEIYNDLEHNVTHIYNRRNILFAIDLVWHSVLEFYFDKTLIRGWLDILIMGETRCGKSKTAERLGSHYQCGEFITGENISKAGLVGGVNSTDGSSRIIQWGRFPRNNEGLVIIDELSTLDVETISSISALRSSGIAEVIKIISGKAPAKTRKVFLSNARNEKTFDSVQYPIELIADLIGRTEDIARFDLILGIRQNDTTSKHVSMQNSQVIEHIYTSQISQTLLKKIWQLKPDQVKFTKAAASKIYDVSDDLIKAWTTNFPMVVGAEQHERMARLCTALAARLHSFDDDGNLIVRQEHVDYMYNFITDLFKNGSLSYGLFVQKHKSKKAEQELLAPHVISKILTTVPRGREVLEFLIERPFITFDILEAELNITSSETKGIVRKLTQLGLVEFDAHKRYVRTPYFNSIVRENYDAIVNTLKEKIYEEQIEHKKIEI